MQPEERDAFVDRLSADATLKKTTEEMEMLFLGIQEASLQMKMDDFHKEMSPRSKVVPFKTWLVAASVLVILGFTAWYFMFSGSTKEKLYAQFFQPDPGLPTAMGSVDNYHFDRAMIDYKTGNYEAAIKAWDSLLAANPANDTLNYFLGSSWMALKESGKAIVHFEKVIALPNSAFAKEAYWYAGLAYIKEGDKKKSKTYIERSGNAQKEALLDKLKD